MAHALGLPVPIQWPAVDVVLEAGEQSPSRRVQRAARAAADIVRDFRRLEGETAAQLLARLERLKRELLAAVGVGLADGTPATVDRLLRDVDALIVAATTEILGAAARPFAAAVQLGQQAAVQPVRALQITIPATFRGSDGVLERTAEDNTLDLLTPPMRQFASEIRTSIRRAALGQEQRMVELQRLQKLISARGLDHAAYRAERIVRTELGRVFGEATFARLEELAKTFAFLKKAWKATNDRRTRLGHREAGQTYARGKGIPIAERFQVAVYDERGKAGPKRLGVAALRFPVDPLATPAGRLAASSTILCRCHAVVDVDVSRFAEFATVQVQVALGGPSAPPPPPPPAVPPVSATPSPRRPRAPRAPRPTPPPPLTPPSRAIGTPVSSAVGVASSPTYRKVTAALSVIDSVHGDGVLPQIPAGPVRKGTKRGVMAYYAYSYTGEARAFGYTAKSLKDLPFMTVFHETGHFLDHQGVARRQYASAAARSGQGRGHVAIDGMRDVLTALEGTRSLQVLQTWRLALLGQGGQRVGVNGVPHGLSLRFVNYLLEPEEQFARAYAQYIATRSAHPAAVAELRQMQAAAKPVVDGLPDGAPRSQAPFWKASATPGAWQYPWQWQDDDFRPVAEAFDRLFEVMGWRRPAV